jgi:hypothetical protein
VVDVEALRNLAARAIDVTAQRSDHLAVHWRIDPASAPVAGTFDRSTGGRAK